MIGKQRSVRFIIKINYLNNAPHPRLRITKQKPNFMHGKNEFSRE